MPDPSLLVPTVVFDAVTAYATAVAATETELLGEPFGVRLPGRVRTHLALGLGAAVTAPWPMAAVATWAATRDTPGAARTVAAVGALVLVGTLAEPVTWGRRPASARARATIPLHLASGAAMVWAGKRRLANGS